MAGRPGTGLVSLLAGVLLLTGGPRSAPAHILLDGEVVQAFLLDLVEHQRQTRDGPTEEARSEALYLLGEKVHQLVELMNTDLTAHGKSLYAELLARRLESHGIRVSRVEGTGRYAYDLAAFHEYLKKAPQGKRAADSQFRLIAETFRGTMGKDPAELVGTDVDRLRRTILQTEAFLKAYPAYQKVREVRFFLAMDYYRLSRNSPDPAVARRYRTLAAQALHEIVKEYPGTAEARAAEITAETLQAAGR
jgi:hypothetical protein